MTYLFTLLLPIGVLTSPSEPERYDPVEYSNQGTNTYEIMEKAKELTGLLEARMEHLLKLKLGDAKRSYKGLNEERFKGELETLLKLIKGTQRPGKPMLRLRQNRNTAEVVQG